MFTKIETVTPAEAQKWLDTTEKNGAKNRRVSPYRVSLLAQQIQRGLWKVTHQGIALDKKGNVVDGQHRLLAIIEANKSIQIPVTRGLENGALEVVDRGRSRSVGDLLGIRGETNGSRKAAIARAMIAFIRDEGEGNPKNLQIIDQDIFDVMDKFKDDLEWVLSLPSQRRLGSAPVQACLVIAHAVMPNSIDVLARRFFTGADLEPGDPMLTLRNLLLKEGYTDFALRRYEHKIRMMKYVFNALHHAVRGDKLVRNNESINGYNFFKQRAMAY